MPNFHCNPGEYNQNYIDCINSSLRFWTLTREINRSRVFIISLCKRLPTPGSLKMVHPVFWVDTKTFRYFHIGCMTSSLYTSVPTFHALWWHQHVVTDNGMILVYAITYPRHSCYFFKIFTPSVCHFSSLAIYFILAEVSW